MERNYILIVFMFVLTGNLLSVNTLSPPPCQDPSALAASNITATAVDLSWTENGSATQWDIEITTGAFTYVPNINNTTSNPHSISVLTPNTTYYFQVRADCGGTTSAWIDGGSFTTLAAPPGDGKVCATAVVISSMPYTDANQTSCGSNDDYSSSSSGACGSNYMNGDDFVYEYTPLMSCDVNVSLTATQSWIGVIVSDGCPDVGSCVQAITSTGSSASGTVSLTGGNTYYFTVSTYPSPQCLTDYTLSLTGSGCDAPPVCDNAPTGLNATNLTGVSVDLSWTENSTASNWDIEYNTTGTFTGTPTVEDVASNPYTLTGLSPTTTYYYQVRSDCGGTNSTWTDGGSFTTTTVTYCDPNPSSVDGIGITRVVFGTIDNSTGDEAGHYGDYSAMSNAIAPSTIASVDITYETGYTYGTKIWIDFNDDGDFTDSGELVFTGLSTNSNPTTLNATFNVGSVLGAHRMRIGGTDNNSGPSTPCYTGSYGSFEDYTIIIGSGVDMTYDGTTVFQADVNPVSRGLNNQVIIGISIKTLDSGNPFDLTEIKLNMNGTILISDVTDIKIYYTGTLSEFTPINQFGPTTAAASGTITINGIQTLTMGSNYFWIAYDLPGTATIDNWVEASCESVIVDGTTYSSPGDFTGDVDGKRQIIDLPATFSTVIGNNINGSYFGRAVVYDASDDTYIIGGFANDPDLAIPTGGTDFCIVKTDVSGTIIWSTYLGGVNSDQAYDITLTSGGSLVVVGNTSSYGTDDYNMMAAKLNASTGALIWTTVFEQGNNSEYAYAVIENTAGEYIIAGEGSSDMYVWRLSSAGTILNTKSVNFTRYAYDLIQTIDGGYLIAGTHDNTNFCLVKLYSDLTKEWTMDWSHTASSEYLYKVIENSAHDYTVFGTSYGGLIGSSDYYAMRFYYNPLAKALPAVTWTKAYGTAGGESLKSACGTGDGGYIMTGLTDGLGSGGDEVYIVRTNSSGDIVWTNVIGTGTWDDEGYDVVRATTGGFVIGGLANRPRSHYYLIRTGDATGYCCGSTDTGGSASDIAAATISTSSSHTVSNESFGVLVTNPSPTTKTGAVTTTICETLNPIVLNVSLIDFKANCSDGFAELSWETASEKNNDFFAVERSEDGLNWNELAIIRGIGNSNRSVQYEYTDDKEIEGISYYRLKQVDYDGTTNFSDVIMLECNSQTLDISLYPNPAKNQFNISLDKIENQELSFELYNSIGQQLKRGTVVENHTIVDVSDVPKGIYMIVFKSKNELITKKKLLVNYE